MKQTTKKNEVHKTVESRKEFLRKKDVTCKIKITRYAEYQTQHLSDRSSMSFRDMATKKKKIFKWNEDYKLVESKKAEV